MALYLGNLKISGAGGGGTGSAAYEKKTVYPYADSSNNQYAASDILASVFPIRFLIGGDQWVVNNGSNVNLESVHRNEDGRDVIELMIHGVTIPGAPGAVDLTMGLCQIGLDGYYIGPANRDYYYANDDVIDEGDLSVGQSNTLPVQGVTKFFNLSAAFKLSDRAMNFLAVPEHSTYTLDQLDQIIVALPESSSAPGKAREFALIFDNEYCFSVPDLVLSAGGDGFYDTGEGGPGFKRGCVTVMNFNEVASNRGVNYFALNQQFLHNVDIPKLDAYWGLMFTAIDAGAIVEMEKTGSSGLAPAVSLEYSLDNGNTWSPFIIGETTIVLANAGDTVCFQAGDGGTGGDGVNLAMGSLYDNGVVKGVNKFKIVSGRIAVSGDISSILNRNGTVDQLMSGAFSELFKDCISLVRAPKLPAVSMGMGCYQGMFQGCTSLTRAPELPATVLAERCYSCMFRTCTSLVQAPKLSTTALARTCYQSMFQGCTSLTQAPELPAVILANTCYQGMFWDCTSLTQAPELPAVILADGCYQSMFQGCTSLTQAPELPAITLSNVSCYNMFENCSNLFYIKVHFTSWGTSTTLDWVSGVRSTGIFICKNVLPHTTFGSSSIPSNWTVITF